MGRACGTYRRQERCIQSFGKNLRKGEPLKGLGVGGRIILKWILDKGDGESWTGFDLAQDRNKWRILVNAVLNLRVP